MAYSRKFEGLYNSLDYNYVAEMTQKNTQESFNMIVDCYNNRKELKKSAIEGQKKALKKLNHYKQVVKEILNEYKPSH